MCLEQMKNLKSGSKRAANTKSEQENPREEYPGIFAVKMKLRKICCYQLKLEKSISQSALPSAGRSIQNGFGGMGGLSMFNKSRPAKRWGLKNRASCVPGPSS